MASIQRPACSTAPTGLAISSSRIDPATGSGTAIGPFGFTAVRSLEFEAATNSLYGTDLVSDQLLRIDVQTGDATAIGNLGFINVLGLALDPATGTLYGTDHNTQQLIAIDPQTGVGTAIGPWGFVYPIECLAWDPATGTLHGVDTLERLLEFDPQSRIGNDPGKPCGTT